MIIDTHQHIGRSMFSGVETTEAELIEALERHGVDLALVMPQPSLEDVYLALTEGTKGDDREN